MNGVITNMGLRPGTYVSVGHGAIALIDEDTLRVEGYFEETKLPRIHVGSRATIRLMGDDRDLTGHVESIASGIVDRERSDGVNLLADVNPTFSSGAAGAARSGPHQARCAPGGREPRLRPHGDRFDHAGQGAAAACPRTSLADARRADLIIAAAPRATV